LERWVSQFKRMTLVSQELRRIQMPHSYLDQCLMLILMLTQKDESPASMDMELIFNVNEIDSCDREEWRPKQILVPSESRDTQFHYLIDRQLRHQRPETWHSIADTLCCIFACSNIHCPLLVSWSRQARSTFDRGIRECIDAKIETHGSPGINDELFERYVWDIFLSAVESHQKLPEWAAKRAIRLCDSRSAHCPEDLLSKLAEHGILLIIYPTRAFNVLRHNNYDLNFHLDHIIRIFCDYEMAIISFTIGKSQ
jgi:hypothetical protein